MKFGPYRQQDIKQIETVLQAKGIPYQVIFASEELEQKRENWKNEPVGAVYMRTAVMDFSCLYVEFSEERIFELGTSLEAYGIDMSALAPPPSFDSEANSEPHRRGLWRAWVALGLFTGLIPAVLFLFMFWLFQS